MHHRRSPPIQRLPAAHRRSSASPPLTAAHRSSASPPLTTASDLTAAASYFIKFTGCLRLDTTNVKIHACLPCGVVDQGVKTNKGFKDTHFNQVVRAMSEYVGIEVTRTQVYNHLHKWRGRWMKIEKLKDISGALWDEKQNMISLDDGHYLGYIREHPNFAEFLNKPLENYKYMETIFQSGQATGKLAMGSNEALGAQSEIGESATGHHAYVDLGDDGATFEDNNGAAFDVNGAAFGVDTRAAVDTPENDSTSSSRERKRAAIISEEEIMIFTNMTGDVKKMASAIKEILHSETHPDVYGSITNFLDFPAKSLLAVLEYLMKHKTIVFLSFS